MPEQERATTGIIRSVGQIGGATVLVALVNLLRTKIIAELVGAGGIGLLGLFEGVSAFAARISGLGLATGGVRGIVERREDPARQAQFRRALFLLNLGLGGTAALVFWFFGDCIAEFVLDDPDYGPQMALIGFAVFALQMVAGQVALLQGFSRIRDIAVLRICSAIVSLFLCVGVVAVFREAGIVWILVLMPVTACLLGAVFIRRVPRLSFHQDRQKIAGEMRGLLSFGLVFAIGGALAAAANLLVRALVLNHGGIADAGQLHAVMVLAMQTIGFVIAAMEVDYFPRLTRRIGNRRALHALVNRQSEIGLRLAGPVIIALAGLSVPAVMLLFSDEFHVAGELLGWWMIGEVLRIPAFACIYVFIARGQTLTYVIIQGVGVVVYVGISYLVLVAQLDLIALAIAYCAMSFAITGLTTALLFRGDGFRWSATVLRVAAILVVAVCGLRLLAAEAPALAGVVGLIAATTFALIAWRRLVRHLGKSHPVARRLAGLYRRVGWPITEAGAQ